MELDPPNPNDEPVFGRVRAPEHAPGFWSSLESELQADIVAANTVVPGIEVTPGPTEVIAVVPPVVLGNSAAGSRTEQLVAVSSDQERDSGPRWQVLAAAAAMFVVVLVGFGLLRNNANDAGELVAAGEVTPGAPSSAVAAGTQTDEAEGDQAQAAQTQPEQSDATEPETTQAEPSATSAPAATTAPANQDDNADGTRFLTQNDDRLLYFAETIPTGASNCTYQDQNVIEVHAPDGSTTTLAGRIYPHVNEMIVSDDLFALITSNCDGGQMLEVGRMERDGRMITSRTMRGRVSDDAPAIFAGVNLDPSTGSVSFNEAASGTTNFSPQVIEIDPPLRPTPAPAPTATPKPLPTLPPENDFFDRARLIGSSNDGDIDWYTFTDPSATCADEEFSQIMVIAADGPANVVHSPQFTYSGNIGFFVANDSTSRVAFLATCGSQIELHVATLGTAGTFASSELAWVGLGSPDNGFVVWSDETVTLNSLQQDGTPFFVEYEPSSGRIIDSNIPSASVTDGGTPDGLYRSPVGASADGTLVYFNGEDPSASPGCEGTTNTLWVENAAGDWLQAVPTGLELDVVTAFAFEQASAQVVFADSCESAGSTFYVGLVQVDGRIANVRAISMEPYVPGHITQLFWIGPSRVRIETDNSFWNVDPKRFEYDLRADVMVQLDR